MPTAKVGVYDTAAVVSDAGPCAEVGVRILEEGGTAVDSAVATLLCNGAVHPQSSGVGGGFVMTVYNKESATSNILVARERAPLAATEDMYHGNQSPASKVNRETSQLHNVTDEM